MPVLPSHCCDRIVGSTSWCLSGVASHQRLKLAEIARASRPDLKVLFVTGYAENAAFRGDFLDAGMDMLTKPFALDELAAKVRVMIER